MTTDEKYVVFKKEDWERWQRLELERTVFAYNLPVPLEDAVVLRHQDFLAAPMLGLYRDMLTMLLKVQKDQRAIDVEAMQKTADWFDENAAEAADAGWKLPD